MLQVGSVISMGSSGTGTTEVGDAVKTVNALARLLDRGEQFLFYGPDDAKYLEAAHYLIWKWNEMERRDVEA